MNFFEMLLRSCSLLCCSSLSDLPPFTLLQSSNAPQHVGLFLASIPEVAIAVNSGGSIATVAGAVRDAASHVALPGPRLGSSAAAVAGILCGRFSKFE
jgi:hypothetical protein